MSDRSCSGCEVRIVRGDPSLSSCAICKRVFHQLRLSLTAPGTPLDCANCSTPSNTASSAARERGTRAVALPPSTPALPISLATVAATHSTTPSVSSQSSKRRASTPSASITPASKSHCPIITLQSRRTESRQIEVHLRHNLFLMPRPRPRITAKHLHIYMDGFARAHEQTQIAISGLHARMTTWDVV